MKTTLLILTLLFPTLVLSSGMEIGTFVKADGSFVLLDKIVFCELPDCMGLYPNKSSEEEIEGKLEKERKILCINDFFSEISTFKVTHRKDFDDWVLISSPVKEIKRCQGFMFPEDLEKSGFKLPARKYSKKEINKFPTYLLDFTKDYYNRFKKKEVLKEESKVIKMFDRTFKLVSGCDDKKKNCTLNVFLNETFGYSHSFSYKELNLGLYEHALPEFNIRSVLDLNGDGAWDFVFRIIENGGGKGAKQYYVFFISVNGKKNQFKRYIYKINYYVC